MKEAGQLTLIQWSQGLLGVRGPNLNYNNAMIFNSPLRIFLCLVLATGVSSALAQSDRARKPSAAQFRNWTDASGTHMYLRYDTHLYCFDVRATEGG